MIKNKVGESDDELSEIEFGDYKYESTDESVDTGEYIMGIFFDPAEINITTKAGFIITNVSILDKMYVSFKQKRNSI